MDHEKFSQFLRFLEFAKSAIGRALGARRNGINHLEDLDPHAEATSLALAEVNRAGEAIKEIRRGLQTRSEAKEEREANKVPVRAHKRTLKKKGNQKERESDANGLHLQPESESARNESPPENESAESQETSPQTSRAEAKI